MIKAVVLAIAVAVFNCSHVACFASSGAQQQFDYEHPVNLNGKLKSGKGYDSSEKYVKYPLIDLVAPITVNAIPNVNENETEKNVSKIQLSMNEKLFKKYESLKGKNVTVTCSELFHQITGHHFTKVLCTVTEIKQRNSKNK